MRILITGAMGGVGQALAVALAPRHDVTAVSHKQLDVTDMTAVLDIAHTVHPNVIINAAAMADVDACAQYPMRAWQVNALAPQFLANAATEVNAVLLHFSSDYVFSGEKGQPYVETDLTDRSATANMRIILPVKLATPSQPARAHGLSETDTRHATTY